MADHGSGEIGPMDAGSGVPPQDRATIARIVEELVPALSATLAADGLAEVEVRRPGWRVRVRRAASVGERTSASENPGGRRRSQERPAHGERDRDRDRTAHGDPESHHDRSNGSGPAAHPARAARRDADPPEDRFRVVATSPSVGPFRPDRELRRGARVREGDRLGTVDLLGVPQEVVSPADAIVMAVLVEADEAVEYGQPLVELERASSGSGTSTGGGASSGGSAGPTPAGAGEG